MASNDVIKAQRYAEEAKIAAATAKLYSQGNSDYSAAAAAYADNALTYSNDSESYSYLSAQYYSYATNLSSWFIGTFADAPVLRNDGSALEIGDMYKNSTDDEVYSYNSDGTWTNLSFDAVVAKEYYEYNLDNYKASVENYEYIAELTKKNSDTSLELADPSGAGLVGYGITQDYAANTVGAKLNRIINIEDYADANSDAGDWTTAIQNAINAATSSGLSDVYGTGDYYISDTIAIQNVGSKGINIFINSLSTTDSFPAMNSFWDATPMINIGDNAGNMISINLFINNLNGGGKADGIIASGFGYALSHIHIGYATNCISVMREGKHTWPNASNWITGDYWVNNYLGLYLADGTGDNAPITEGWKYDVKFTAANYLGGIWMRRSGRYAQLRGDWDFNGKYLSILQLSDTTGLDLIWDTQQLKLTNGTTTCEFLFYYLFQGYFYVVMAEDHDVSKVSGTGSSFSVGDTLTCTSVDGVALGVGAVNVAQDNDSGSNYFDILHDFERGTFGKIQVTAGYLSGVIGGLQFTSSWQYQNSFSGTTDSLRGFGVSNSGTALAFYNYALSNLPWANITSDFVNFEKKLYLKDHKVTGAEVLATIASSTTDYTDVLTLTDSSTDKYADEGSKYHIEIITNYGGCGASFDVWLKGNGNVIVTNRKQLNAAFKFRFITVLSSDSTLVTGVNMQLRQQAQDYITFVINQTRIN